MTAGAAIPPVSPGRPPAPRRRCARHDEREAVGRCTECGGGFCRECLTEHEDRLYCGPCFAARVESVRRAKHNGSGWRRTKTLALTCASLASALVMFYLLGRVLSVIPADLHDGTIWREDGDR